ncbi:unnamed protein product [Pseudo-nitzschia multistriata]|uniref:Uncharacterized protein n=1 Tax=Pseudo-nitzschia multistriata TaxID=183589 RepID=A0A448Z6B6_9STRA|nr:unnamed protein product [Pseudo-nitzschia multistriata]
MAEVETTPPVSEETQAEEQAPITNEESKEPTAAPVAAEFKKKKSMFSSFCGCFGGTPAVAEEKKTEDEVKEETDKPAVEDKQEDTDVQA